MFAKQHQLDRRQLVGSVATGLLAGSLANSRPEAVSNAGNARAHRSGYKNKFSLAAYSYRSLLDEKQPRLTLFDFVDDCVRFGLEGTELTSYYFPKPTTPEFICRLKAHCFRKGIDISGTAIGNDFGHPSGPDRDREIAHTKEWIEFAGLLGAPVIRIFAGHVPDGADPNETHRLMVSALEECCDYAGQHGVFLALENHGGPTATAEGLLKFVNDVKSPWFGVNLDTGNFHSDDVYRDLAEVAPAAINVQVKVSITEKGVKQPSDFPKLASILRDKGYNGYVVLEYEEAEDPIAACPRYLDQLRGAFSQ